MITAKEALEIAKLNTTEDVSEHIAYIEKLIKKIIYLRLKRKIILSNITMVI